MDSSEIGVAVDLVAFTLAGGELCVLMGRRPHPPYPGHFALPGKLRRAGVSVDEVARDLLTRTTSSTETPARRSFPGSAK